MKKLVIILLSAILSIIGLTACAGGESAPAGTTAEIADRVFQQAGVQPFGVSEKLSAENMEFYLGTLDYPEFADSVVIIPMISIDTRVQSKLNLTRTLTQTG